VSANEEVSFTLQLTVDQTITELRRLQTAIHQSLALFTKMGLPPEINKQITLIQRSISVMNQARLAAIALHAGLGPIGWILGAIGIAGAAVSAFDTAAYATDQIDYMNRG
jgi:hypothetical protein